MVIGFDASRAFLGNKTGTENYSFQLLHALAKIDNKNKYIVYTRSKNISSVITSLMFKFPENFSFKEVKWPRLWTQGGLAIQTFVDDLDVLFVPSHTLPIFRRPGLKTIMTVHDLGSEYLPSMHQLKQRLYLSYMQKMQLQTATKIIAVSKSTKIDLINRIGIKKEKIEVVYEGFDKKLFHKTKTDVLSNSLKQYYIFVGTIQPRKNLERLIVAFSRQLSAIRQSEDRRLTTDDLKLVIVGSKGWLSDEIYKLPKILGIEGRVKFLGYVPDKDMPALYSGAEALLFPSLFEGFGLPILEAQACGCPVLTSNVSSMPEVAGSGAVFVDPNSEEDIIRGIKRLQETGYREQLIRKGFENAKKFSWDKCARETLAVLKEKV